MNRTGSVIVGALAVLLTIAAAGLPSAPTTSSAIAAVAAPTTDNGLASMEPVGGPVNQPCECTWPEYACTDGLACKHQPFNFCGQCVEPH